MEGFRYTWGIRGAEAAGDDGSHAMASMPLVVLMPFFADDIFHRGVARAGHPDGAMGMGAVAGTLVLAWRAGVTGLPRVIFRVRFCWAPVSGLCMVEVFYVLAGDHAAHRL